MVTSELDPAVDYTQGYGSFYLPPPISVGERPSLKIDYRYIKGNGIKTAGSGSQYASYRRRQISLTKCSLEPFPFMKLPLEIRYKIYKILLAPLCNDRQTSGFGIGTPEISITHGFRFKVYDGEYDSALPEIDSGHFIAPGEQQSSKGPEEQPYSNLEIYRALQDGTAADSQVPSGWTASERVSDYFQDTSEDSAEDTSEDSSDEDEDVDMELSEFPEVNLEGVNPLLHPAYEVGLDQNMAVSPHCLATRHEVPEWLSNCSCSEEHKDDLVNIQRLSRISRHFTIEFGECLWENAIIHIENPELFFVFFRDRPALPKHIKGLVLDVQYSHEDQEDFFDTSASLLIKISEFISQHLDLRSISLHLATDWRFVHDIPNMGSKEKFDIWTAIMRSLKTTEEFVVHLNNRNHMTRDDPKKIEEKILELWLPTSLTQARMTEQDVYRNSRSFC